MTSPIQFSPARGPDEIIFHSPSENDNMERTMERTRIDTKINIVRTTNLPLSLDPFCELGDYFSIEDEQSDVEGEQNDSFISGRINRFADESKKGMKTNAEIELIKITDRIDSLEREYTKEDNSYIKIISYPNYFFYFFKYVGSNKDNFVNFCNLCLPEQTDELNDHLEKIDQRYKWTDCIFHVLSNEYSLYHIQFNQARLENLNQQYQQSYKSQIRSELVSHNPNETIKKINEIRIKLEDRENSKKLERKSKLCTLITKIISLVLTYFNSLDKKIGDKCSKYVCELFNDGRELWYSYNIARPILKQWRFDLEIPNIVHISENRAWPESYEELKEQVPCEEPERIVNETKEIIENAAIFYNDLINFKTIEEVQNFLAQCKVQLDIPPTIKEFQAQLKNSRFKQDLRNIYYSHIRKRPVIPEEQVATAIRSQRQQNNRKIDAYVPWIVNKIQECEGKSFLEIKNYFSELHIDINSIIPIPGSRLPPESRLPIDESLRRPESKEYLLTNTPLAPRPEPKFISELMWDECIKDENFIARVSNEWEECIKDEKFIKTLSQKWISFQEENEQMCFHAMKQILLSKIGVINKSILYQEKKYYFDLLCTIIEMVCLTPFTLLSPIKKGTELLTSKLPKRGIPILGAINLFIPSTKFKLIAIAQFIFDHYYFQLYKPNEYSLKGYKIFVEKDIAKLRSLTYFLQFHLNQMLLWINIFLIEGCIQDIESGSFAKDLRNIDLIKQSEENIANCKTQISNLELKLSALRLADSKLASSAQFDPVESLADAMNEADIECWSDETKYFFENQLNFRLTNENISKIAGEEKSRFQLHLEKFLSKGDLALLQSYSDNRLSYLKN